VKIERDSFKILENSGNVRSVSLQEIGNKRNSKDTVAFDAYRNEISVEDVVQVKEGPYKVLRVVDGSNLHPVTPRNNQAYFQVFCVSAFTRHAGE
jgi:hypothetical protein